MPYQEQNFGTGLLGGINNQLQQYDYPRLILSAMMQARQKALENQALMGLQNASQTPTYPTVTQPQMPNAQNPRGVAGTVSTSPVMQPTPMTDPNYQTALLALQRLNPQMANTQMQLQALNQPTFKELTPGGVYGTVTPSTGKFSPQGITPFRPTMRAGEFTWTTDTNPDGTPKLSKIPGTNETKTWEVEIDRATGLPTGNRRLATGGTSPSAPNIENQLDKSYQFHTSQISALAKPLQDRVDRMERLKVSLDQHNPQADALIAPELLTAMAGGMGSGLRMNEAEISRIVGGRNLWENLKSSLMKLQTDPTKPFLIPDAQRAQIYSLMNAMNDKIQAKNNAVIQSQQDLANAKTPQEHKTIFSNLRKMLASDATAQPNVGDTKTFPNGKKGRWDGQGWEQIP